MSNKDDIEYDEFCDPDNPRTIEFEDIQAANERIEGYVVRTPCRRAKMSDKHGMEIYLKQEFLQVTGCFKERGVVNTLLQMSDEQKKIGACTASTGNHGAALSYHTHQMGIPSCIFMPVHSPITKIKNNLRYKAKLILKGESMKESKHHAMAMAKEKQMMYINGYDNPYVIAGQGTIGIEIIEQVPNVDAVLVPVGGGSLLAGIAIAVKHLKPDTEIYAIETDTTASLAEALKKNELVTVEMGQTMADGMAVNRAGVNVFHNIKRGILDKMVVVREDWVARAVLHIVENEKYVVEGAGAAPIAAILAGLCPNLKGKVVVCITSGGNIDTTTLARALERGMAADGRLIKFKVTVSDRPGGMAELLTLLASIGVSIRDMLPERAWIRGNVYRAQVKMICETRGWDHVKEVMDIVKKNYKEYFFDETCENEKTMAVKRGPCLAPNPICMQK